MFVRSLTSLWFAIRMNGPKMAFVAVACDHSWKSRRVVGVGGALRPLPLPNSESFSTSTCTHPCPVVFYTTTSIYHITIRVFFSIRRRVSSRLGSYHYGTHLIHSSCRRLKATSQSRTVSVRRAPSLVNLVAAGRSSVMVLIQYVPVALQEAIRVVYTSCKQIQDWCLRPPPDRVNLERPQFLILRSSRTA
jgi:hypothetical protein